jgi:transcriptional regulator with XRE-family HTH domain
MLPARMSSGELLRSLGEMIRASRISAGLTQRTLGDRAGIVGKYVSEIERGTRDVPLSTLFAIVEDGLQLQLQIAFLQKGNDGGRIALPMNIEAIATLIVELPAEPRAKVVALVRGILELIR